MRLLERAPHPGAVDPAGDMSRRLGNPMSPPWVTVDTEGSVVWLDDANARYHRMPNTEGPRERPEWGGQDAGPLQDAVWHPMDGWEIGPHLHHRAWLPPGGRCGCDSCPGLIVHTDRAARRWLFFPRAAVR